MIGILIKKKKGRGNAEKHSLEVWDWTDTSKTQEALRIMPSHPKQGKVKEELFSRALKGCMAQWILLILDFSLQKFEETNFSCVKIPNCNNLW